MKLPFPELAALLNEDPILSYQLLYQLFHALEGLKDVTLWYRPGGRYGPRRRPVSLR